MPSVLLWPSGTNNVAEFLTLKECMMLCKYLNLSGSIESDFSLIVVVIRFAIIGGLSMFGIIYF